MKRLTTLFILSLTFALLQVAPVFAAHFWQVKIQDPSAETTNRTLSITYEVLSVNDSENLYFVDLYENGSVKASQTINTPQGDSRTFTFDLPRTGTYSYFVEVDNDVAGEVKRSKTVTVEVTNAPEPTVRTITVETTQPAAQPAGGAEAAAAPAPGGGAVVAQAPAPGEDAEGQEGAIAQEDAGAADDQETAEGQTTPEAQTTDEGTEEGDVLGEGSERAAGSSNTAWWIALLAVVVAGVGYGVYRFRPKL